MFRYFILLQLAAMVNCALQNCPMSSIRSIILRASQSTSDPSTQMQMIRRIIEDLYGGTWGVIIIKNPSLISQDVHWTIPDHPNSDGSAAFCLTVVNRWQYNIFKTGTQDTAERVTVEDVVNKIRQMDMKQRPIRFSIEELDRRLARVIQRSRKNRERMRLR